MWDIYIKSMRSFIIVVYSRKIYIFLGGGGGSGWRFSA